MGLGSRRTRIYGLCFLGLPGAVWTFSTLSRQPTPSLRRLRMSSASTSGDVLVIGGGLAGLSAALELSLRGAKVMVLNRDSKESASMAAGGMLAPQAERLAPSAYLDLCLQSRSMYTDWITELERIAGPSFSTGFSASGGFLAPAFEGDAVFQWEPPADAGPSYWLDRTQIRGMEPNLSQELAGGWWYPEDMQVDARLLYKTLREACVRSQVTILEGADVTADAVVFHPVHAAVKSVRLKDGRKLEFGKVVVANGAWMNELLPIPVSACKGQMMSLRPQPGTPPPLSRVLFGDGCYIIPKTDGRIVVGATVEDGVMDQRVTAAGLAELTSKALKICPALGALEVEESWAGLRPTTPDFLPVLGTTPWTNLYVAGGYWRNGVLLAPRTGQLLADVVEGTVSDEDATLLQHFSWARFLQNNRQKGSSPVRASPRKAVSAATTPSAPVAPKPVASAPPSASASAPVAPKAVASPPAPAPAKASGTGDPYASYNQGKASSEEEEERSKAILREARRKNREDAVQYGLEEDLLGIEVGSRFAVPSSPLSKEWSVMDEAAERGQAAIAALPWINELGSKYKGKTVIQEVPSEANTRSMTIKEFAEMLGYDLDKVPSKPVASAPAPVPPKPVASASAPVTPKPVAPKPVASTPAPVQAPKASGTGDPYASYNQGKASSEEEEERSKAILREARRKNREDAVQYGLEEDLLGIEVGSRFAVPSSPLSKEWSVMDEAAERGQAAIAALPWINELGSKYKGKTVIQEVPSEANTLTMTIREFAEMLGYDLDKVREVPAGSQPKRGEPDTYDDDYNDEVRPLVGWEVVKRMREEEEEEREREKGGKPKQPQQQAKEKGHTDDPYQDLVKLREEEKSMQVLREARRVNREGMVTMYDDAESLTGDSVQRYSSGVSGEVDRFDQMAQAGLSSGRGLSLDPQGVTKHAPIVSSPISSPISSPVSSPTSSASAMGGKSKAEVLAEYMAGLADEGKGTQRNIAFTAPNAPTTAMQPSAPARQVAAGLKVEFRAATEAPKEKLRPPWAGEIDAMYEKVRQNQQEERRRRGLPATGTEPVVVPFKQTFGEEECRAMSPEEIVSKMELIRINPDGSLTRVLPGQGLPPPWTPDNPGPIEEVVFEEELEEAKEEEQEQELDFGEEGHLERNSTSEMVWALK